MFREEFLLGGPLMYGIFALWVLMLALILERLTFWARRLYARRLAAPRAVQERLVREFEDRAEHNLERIDGLSDIATSVGLFGTVWGIAQSFFARGAELSLAAPEVMASGMATALFTTVAGLAVFVIGQGALLLFRWWTETALKRLIREAGR